MFKIDLMRIISAYRDLIIAIAFKKSKYESLKNRRLNAINNGSSKEKIECFDKSIESVLRDLSRLSSIETSMKYWMNDINFIPQSKYLYFVKRRFLS